MAMLGAHMAHLIGSPYAYPIVNLANLPGGIGCKNPRVARIAHILCSISVGYQEGKFKAYNKSEPIPEVNNETVKVVVADNFNDFVLKSRKNVLFEFYAPWCGRCKKLAPTLQEAAVSLKNEDVVIAKMELN